MNVRSPQQSGSRAYFSFVLKVAICFDGAPPTYVPFTATKQNGASCSRGGAGRLCLSGDPHDQGSDRNAASVRGAAAGLANILCAPDVGWVGLNSLWPWPDGTAAYRAYPMPAADHFSNQGAPRASRRAEHQMPLPSLPPAKPLTSIGRSTRPAASSPFSGYTLAGGVKLQVRRSKKKVPRGDGRGPGHGLSLSRTTLLPLACQFLLAAVGRWRRRTSLIQNAAHAAADEAERK
jgi:hypothetical protein